MREFQSDVVGLFNNQIILTMLSDFSPEDEKYVPVHSCKQHGVAPRAAPVFERTIHLAVARLGTATTAADRRACEETAQVARPRRDRSM